MHSHETKEPLKASDGFLVISERKKKKTDTREHGNKGQGGRRDREREYCSYRKTHHLSLPLPIFHQIPHSFFFKPAPFVFLFIIHSLPRVQPCASQDTSAISAGVFCAVGAEMHCIYIYIYIYVCVCLCVRVCVCVCVCGGCSTVTQLC